MANFFDNVKPGSRVHYLTPQGQTHSGTVVINKGTHLVLNRGGGQPQVVTPKNYVKHSEGGKVKGALLSNLAKSMKKEEVEQIDEISQKTKNSYIAKRGSQLSSFLYAKRSGVVQQRMTGRQQKNAVKGLRRATGAPVGVNAIASFANKEKTINDIKRKFGYGPVSPVKEEVINEGSYKIAMNNYAHDHASDYLNGGNKNAYGVGNFDHKAFGVTKKKAESDYKKAFKGHVNDMIFNYEEGRSKKRTHMGEESENINELDNKTLLNYVGKAIRQGGNNPYLDVLSISDKNKARARKRAKGLMAANRAFGRNFKAGKTPPEAFMQPKMNNEDAQLDAQKSALAYTTKMQKKKKKRTLKTMKEEIINELGGETLSRYVTKALADRKKQAGMADMAHRIHTPERAKYFADKAAARIAKRGAGIKTAVAKIASNLPAEPLRAHTEGEKSKHGGWSGMGEEFKRGDKVRLKSIWADSGKENEVYTIKHRHWSNDKRHWISDKDGRGFYAHNHQLRTARTWNKDYSKTDEARESEYRANQYLGGKSPRREPGHYLVRDGRTLSGPHKPDEAVSKYREMSDSKNVKIVHVKEAVENKAKAEKAVKFALNKAKKQKGKTANVEPEMETPNASMSQPMLQGQEGPGNVRI